VHRRPGGERQRSDPAGTARPAMIAKRGSPRSIRE
jgi:hypothetical protein